MRRDQPSPASTSGKSPLVASTPPPGDPFLPSPPTWWPSSGGSSTPHGRTPQLTPATPGSHRLSWESSLRGGDRGDRETFGKGSIQPTRPRHADLETPTPLRRPRSVTHSGESRRAAACLPAFDNTPFSQQGSACASMACRSGRLARWLWWGTLNNPMVVAGRFEQFDGYGEAL
eukprot:1183189-Prorocentrum_minimum.AAC.4